ncbi:MAG: MBL fold metallo-hydrolase [Chloroflexi bacterium]|nr:MBL fold metallo-hydrolase [Chloroflexota bacterium]MCI0644937.1 MBL fold metallo-hydrolase [Chloroflexota bacterium]
MNTSTTQPRLELRKRAVGPWPMNTYALVCPTTNESILVDPGADPDTLLEMLGDSRPVAILLTHTHPDHVGALAEMRQRLHVPLLAHAGPHHQEMQLNADRHLDTGDTVAVGRHTLQVYHAPGHIPDQICLLLEDDTRAIVGDTIFEGGPGKTWSAGDFQTTLATLRRVVLSWPDDTVCYPGHGPAFRLGDLRPAIETFLSKGHGDFYGDATWDM